VALLAAAPERPLPAVNSSAREFSRDILRARATSKSSARHGRRADHEHGKDNHGIFHILWLLRDRFFSGLELQPKLIISRKKDNVSNL
jgi:hypothetical protein